MKIVRKGVRRCFESTMQHEHELSLMQNDVVKLAHELNEVKSGELDG